MRLFTQKEERDLSLLLSRVPNPASAVSLVALHGLLFGLAITPEAVMPSEWMHAVMGNEEPLFSDRQDAETCLGHLFTAYNRFIHDSNTGKLFFPFDPRELLDEKKHTLVQQWAYGLFLALSLRPDLWGISHEFESMKESDLPEDIREAMASLSIVMSVAFPEKRQEIFSSQPDVYETPEKETTFVLMLPMAIRYLQRYGERLRASRYPAGPSGVKATALGKAKVDRNDPCPCGSGRKYKRCCGST